jgi:hypothetical protein
MHSVYGISVSIAAADGDDDEAPPVALAALVLGDPTLATPGLVPPPPQAEDISANAATTIVTRTAG